MPIATIQSAITNPLPILPDALEAIRAIQQLGVIRRQG
jgi:hypothetical protein